MSVWRVEGEDEKGPYRTDWSGQHALGDAHNLNPHYPAASGGGCGFTSPEDLFLWFDGFWPDLMEYGFRIVRVLANGVDPATTDTHFLSRGYYRNQVLLFGEHPRELFEYPDFLERVYNR